MLRSKDKQETIVYYLYIVYYFIHFFKKNLEFYEVIKLR